MNENKDQNSSWCLVSIGNERVEARISHVGRGKFRVIEDDQGGSYSNIQVDASDVYHCRQ
jgi:hypothetical protein